MRRFFALWILAVALVSCSGGADKQARLVVAIVYDQFPAWAYAEYGELLSPDGALRRVGATGAEHIVEYSYAATHTAPGHAAIFTGAPPAESGVYSNESWTADRGIRSIVDDGQHGVFGLPDAFASPAIIQVDSVADALRRARGDKAKIAGLSFKDRGAVLTTGRDPDLALWYEKKLGRITSSKYYTDALPDWAASWIADHPIEDYFEDWVPGDPERLQQLLGPDDAPGEADYAGFGTTFPHNPVTTTDPARTFRTTPQSADHLLDLARVAVTELNLGEDDIPDLLVLSISNIDYSGHVFGPDSWEYVDNLVRTDAAVGRFLAELESKTSVAVLITSDHGGAHLPERRDHRFPGDGRLYPDALPEEMNAAVSRVIGNGDWVGPYVPPFIYLTDAALASDMRDEAVNALIGGLQALPEVHAAYDAQVAAGWSTDPDPVKRSVAVSIPDPGVGAVFIVRRPGSVDDESFERGKGTGHGSPWPFDTQVPVLFAGPGVTITSSTEPLAQNRVAATLCRLLGVPPPNQISTVDPLPGL